MQQSRQAETAKVVRLANGKSEFIACQNATTYSSYWEEEDEGKSSTEPKSETKFAKKWNVKEVDVVAGDLNERARELARARAFAFINAPAFSFFLAMTFPKSRDSRPLQLKRRLNIGSDNTTSSRYLDTA